MRNGRYDTWTTAGNLSIQLEICFLKTSKLLREKKGLCVWVRSIQRLSKENEIQIRLKQKKAQKNNIKKLN